jgi:hypothetical protein
MDIILLGITIVSLAVAFVMSVAAWRLMRDDKKRSAARVAALSVAASAPETALERQKEVAVQEKPIVKAPWGRASFDSAAVAYATPAPLRTPAPIVPPAELPLNQPARIEPARASEPLVAHASGFLGAEDIQRDGGGRQKSLAFAAVFLFVVLSGGLVWMMAGPRGTTPVAVGPNSPLELVSLTHARQNQKLAVSGLVRNPASGKPIEHLSAVVFLFDRMGTFVTSSRANVDFLKLGAGDESPFVVSLDAPASVARYRVSFRTDDGIVPHIDRRAASVAPEGTETVGIQRSTVKSPVGSPQ